MDTYQLRIKLSCIVLLIAGVVLPYYTHAQTILTIEQALDLAEENNPDLKASKLNLERY